MLTVALKMLTGDRGKYLGLVLGISFTSFFMTEQPALFLGILRNAYGFIQDAGAADLWVMDPQVQYSRDIRPLPDTALGRVRGIEGVGWAVPLFVGSTGVRQADGNFLSSALIGLDDATLVGGPVVMVTGSLSDLKRPDAIIVNADGAGGRLAHPNGVAGEPPVPLKVGESLELNDRRAVVVGISAGGQNETGQPTITTTYSRALSYAPSQRKMLSFVLVRVKPGFDPAKVAADIRRWTSLGAFTQDEFKANTTRYLIRNIPAFTVFGLSTVIAFVIGSLIAGQIFYNFTLDNLRYFGVMKALGAGKAVLRRMVMVQAFMVGAIGYGIGIGAACLFSLAIGASGRLVPQIPAALLLATALAIVVLCVFAAIVSLRRIVGVEPAAAFKS
jgi:putative ABC transport system permease protein